MRKALFAPFIVLCIFLAGCQTLKDNSAAVQLATQYAVLKFIEQSPPESRTARVENIRRIATEARNLVSGESSVSLLQSLVSSELAKLNLSSADRMLADGLVSMIAAELQSRVGDGLLSADQKVQAQTVLDWVIAATQYA